MNFNDITNEIKSFDAIDLISSTIACIDYLEKQFLCECFDSKIFDAFK